MRFSARVAYNTSHVAYETELRLELIEPIPNWIRISARVACIASHVMYELESQIELI